MIRGKAQSVLIYDPPPGSPQRPFQVLITSGDVGWIGLPAETAEHLHLRGYRVVGFNARAYLSSFTTRGAALEVDKIPADFRTLFDWTASSQSAYPASIVMVGVSEGAGLDVLAAGQPPFPPQCKGIIALGLPRKTTLGWRWIDFPMWVTKRDPNEPLAETEPFLRHIRAPLVMIHSSRDEWDSIDVARRMFDQAPEPKRFLAIDASNHRFSDKVPEVLSQIDASLIWLENLVPMQTP
jgi:hypothetical protein